MDLFREAERDNRDEFDSGVGMLCLHRFEDRAPQIDTLDEEPVSLRWARLTVERQLAPGAWARRSSVRAGFV
ncbi:MAG: hypothetical protein ACYC2R_04475 [Burkholderiales bacterium]